VSSAERNPFYVILENVRSLYNVGSAFRTSDGCNISKLFLTGFTGFPPRKEISKTALGAEEYIFWEHQRETADVIGSLRNQTKCQIVAVEKTKQSVDYTKFDFEFPVCLIFGNEIMGISKETLAKCDAAVHIPMLGSKESLNVATAYGVVLYELLRQHENAKRKM